MASDAIYHHLIPQTYMKPWCFSGKTIWTYNKISGKWEDRNIENICGVNYYHSIRANSIYITQKALTEIWGFLRPYHISLNGVALDTPEKLHHAYQEFDNWEILYPKGAKVNKAHRNTIKSQIQQAKYNDIEEQWSIQFENGWSSIITEITQALIDIHAKKPVALTAHAASELMRYFVMFDWRGFSGNKQFNDFFQWFDSIFPFSNVTIPEDDRDLPMCDNVLDEMKHNLLVKQFDLFQAKQGIMYTHQKAWEDHCTFEFLLAPQGYNFITSDNPCFSFTNKDGCVEPFFVALPQLALVVRKKDPEAPYSYTVREITESEISEYNVQIFNHAQTLVLNNAQFDIAQYATESDGH